jgi:hypothetical protein
MCFLPPALCLLYCNCLLSTALTCAAKLPFLQTTMRLMARQSLLQQLLATATSLAADVT